MDIINLAPENQAFSTNEECRETEEQRCVMQSDG